MSRSKKEANNDGVGIGPQPALYEKLAAHVQDLYERHWPRFMQALEDSDKRTITLHFRSTLDMSENAPVVTTTLKFKDHTKEHGMDVIKSFSAGETDVLDDPSQPGLGIGEPEPAAVPARRRGRPRKVAPDDETQSEEPEPEQEPEPEPVAAAPRGRGRPRKMDGKAAAARNDE